MNAVGVLSTAFACLMLSGCKSPQPQYLARPAAIQAQAAYTHVASGMVFPPTVGDFQRVELTRFDAEGLDIGAGYNLVTPSAGIAATVYVYPAPSLASIGSPPDVIASARATLCRKEYERRKREVINSHPGARLLSESEAPLHKRDTAYPGEMAAFEFEDVFAGQRRPLRSDLYVFCYVGGRWALEYRFTSPKNFDSAGKISASMEALPPRMAAGA